MAGAIPPTVEAPHNITIKLNISNETLWQRQAASNAAASSSSSAAASTRLYLSASHNYLSFYVSRGRIKLKMLLHDKQTHNKCELRRLQATLLASRAKKLVALDHSDGCASDGGCGGSRRGKEFTTEACWWVRGLRLDPNARRACSSSMNSRRANSLSSTCATCHVQLGARARVALCRRSSECEYLVIKSMLV